MSSAAVVIGALRLNDTQNYVPYSMKRNLKIVHIVACLLAINIETLSNLQTFIMKYAGSNSAGVGFIFLP